MGMDLMALNIYGPYLEIEEYWMKLFDMGVLKQNRVILGGDLNFSLGRVEI
jgi:hypothetical protein